jgi:hypothetical protein
MIDKIDLLLAGSCWWGFCEDDPLELQNFATEHHQMALSAPVKMATILKVPVVHASHHATFTGMSFPKAEKPQTRQIVGATQIIGEDGQIMERRLYDEDAGVITAEVNFKKYGAISPAYNSEDYWVSPMPTPLLKAWEQLNPLCEQYYQKVAKPYYLLHCK